MSRDPSHDQRRWHVRVRPRTPQLDGHARAVLADIRQIGLQHVEGVGSSRIYLFAGRLNESDVRLLAEELLADPVAERFGYQEGFAERDDVEPAIEVHPLPGVMNPAALSTADAARRLLASKGSPGAALDEVQTARRYEIVGAKSAAELDRIAAKVLANDCVEKWYIQGFDRRDEIPDGFSVPATKPFSIRRVRLAGLSDDELKQLSRAGHLFLSLEEMRAVRDHFTTLGRDPTDLELETLAQTWSEHCVHKTLKSAIDYRGEDFGRPGEVAVRFDNLLADTIAAATHELNRDWCLSVFADNAGIIAFDDKYGVAFKVETHNHPSAIEPYGGAATGVGGCIRDIMGCGLGAKPIASTDVFCLAHPDFDPDRVPAGVLHPRRVLKGVVSGVRDYGNRMGIPTVNGAIYFDDRYLANPLVFCGCIGLIPRDRIHKQPHSDDWIVVAGGRTGRDGIHGATFSSAELTDSHADEFSHAVQIGNAIEEKKLLDAQLIARDHADGCSYSAVTDCGAGGLSSAVGEMGEELGAIVDLEKVPLKYAGLRYDEIWISEAQERMVFAVPPRQLDKFLAIFAAEEVEAAVIGRFADDRVLRVRYEGQTVGELDMRFLHEGLPKTTRAARWSRVGRASPAELPKPPVASAPGSEGDRLLNALRTLNIASKEWVIRQYDHEVQGRSVIKPLVGPAFGPSDAAVLRPVYTSRRGIAVGCGLCPHWSQADPYWMAVRAIDEALRNVICVGADPQRVAILDNFCWPKVDTEESLGALVRTCRGAHDAAVAYGLPFISGKDSLNNQFSMSADESRRTGLPLQLAIPPTLLISALGIVEDVARCVSMDLKTSGNVLVLASDVGRALPAERSCSFDLTSALTVHHRVAALIRDGKVRAAHDVSDGGLAVALAEMCIASGFGATVEVDAAMHAHSLFDEPAACYVLEMAADAAAEAGLPTIGRVTVEPRLRIAGGAGEAIDVAVRALDAAWRAPLANGGGGK
jgi:phosphoribosylformylglycinamidine synthase